MDFSQEDNFKIFSLIRAYQEHGHFIADLDPLKLKHTKFYKLKQEYKKKLDPISFGLSQDSAKELELMINGEKKKRNLEEICAALKEIYCGTVGVQYTHIYSSEKRKWIQEQLESKKMQENSPEIKKKIFLDSVRAETFGDFCGEKFDAKRFGLDGAESLIPGLEALVASAAHHAVKEIVFGMAHRGRLNVMANILQKPADLIFNEFEFGTTKQEKEAVMGSGDLKYHLGTSNNRNFDKNEIHLSLVANPSHLEVANPVVLGKVRAKQTRGPGEVDYNKALGILIHGDAAFPAQGIVSEIMELSQLEDYTVGGTIHVIINNQIGFTTVPKSARTSPYPCESAKASDMPIFHVNGDHPDKVVEVFKLALEFRQKFQEDVLIDLFCYRRHGHNELDNPRFTQPQMYKTIDNHPTLINLYGKQLINEKILTKSDFHKIVKESLSDLQNAYDNRKNVNQDSRDWLQNSWKELDGLCPSNEGKFFETAIDREDIIHILRTLKRVPSAFQVHESLKEHRFKEISEAINTGKGITWAFAEAIAFGSLMIDNFNVRISGEDSERGTFNQRHAVLHCQETGKKHVSLRHLKKTGKQGFFSPVNSPLSENGVLGFEYGYSLEDPMSLVIWEAQFGDFMNGAQVIIDQFLSAAEEKWLRMSGITLFLPHGYEGQGPDHSSARLERFLQFCNDDSDSIPESVLKAAQDINIQVANCTSPANFFHLLRRQMKRNFRKPLVIMTPKSLLTDPRCVSNINEFEAPSEFQRILVTNSDSPIVSPDNVRKVLFCSGRVYYDLLEQKEVKKNQDIIIVRIEQLAPFPYDKIAEQIQIYANAKYFWVQEEPKNQGAWTYVAPRFLTCKKELEISYIGRKPAAAPAEGVKVHHRQAKEKILTEALA